MSKTIVNTEYELLTILSSNYGMVVCDDADVVTTLRTAYPSLFVREFEDGMLTRFPNATYVMCHAKNTSSRSVIIYNKEKEDSEEIITDEENKRDAESNECTVDNVNNSTETEVDLFIGSTEEVVEKNSESQEREEENQLESVTLFFEEGIPLDVSEKYTIDDSDEIVDRTPMKPFDDQDFTDISSMFAMLTSDMRVVASGELVEMLSKERPDINVREMRRGGISGTGGKVVLLKINSNLYKQEARRIYPSDATLFTVTV